MADSIAILGSARSDGNTAKALHRLIDGLPCEIVDLNQRRIASYSYEQEYSGDEFIGLVERIIEAPVTILATPVYWYSYSTVMKKFIDRFSDLLASQKPLGRKLRGCRFALLSTGSDPQPDATLHQAFTNFCGYLGIENVGMVYAIEDGPFHDEQVVAAVRDRIQKAEPEFELGS